MEAPVGLKVIEMLQSVCCRGKYLSKNRPAEALSAEACAPMLQYELELKNLGMCIGVHLWLKLMYAKDDITFYPLRKRFAAKHMLCRAYFNPISNKR